MESKGLTLVIAHAPHGETIPFRSAGMSETANQISPNLAYWTAPGSASTKQTSFDWRAFRYSSVVVIWQTRDGISSYSVNGDAEKQKKSQYDSLASLLSAARDWKHEELAPFSSIEAKRWYCFSLLHFVKVVFWIYIQNASRFDFRLSVQYSEEMPVRGTCKLQRVSKQDVSRYCQHRSR